MIGITNVLWLNLLNAINLIDAVTLVNLMTRDVQFKFFWDTAFVVEYSDSGK